MFKFCCILSITQYYFCMYFSYSKLVRDICFIQYMCFVHNDTFSDYIQYYTQVLILTD